MPVVLTRKCEGEARQCKRERAAQAKTQEAGRPADRQATVSARPWGELGNCC